MVPDYMCFIELLPPDDVEVLRDAVTDTECLSFPSASAPTGSSEPVTPATYCW